MSSVARTVSQVAGAVASVASFIPGAGQVVAAVAGVVALGAGIVADLTAKPPPAQGNVSDVVIASDHPRPFMIGRTYAGGVLRYDRSYGETRRRVPNPYRWMVSVYSSVGPCQGIESLQVDYQPVAFTNGNAIGFYNDFMYTDTQLGARPESSALTPHFAGAPEWGSTSKLSGFLAVGWNLLFDRDGERFANGVPRLGIIGLGEMSYDARLDDTYPGGSGPHRADDESTWSYSANPARNALSYAIGRFQNGIKVMGLGVPIDAIDVDSFVAAANMCDANGWEVGGVVFEPGDGAKWANLKRILRAGNCEPKWNGATLICTFNAPRTSIFTITADDLTDGEVSMVSGRSQLEKPNTAIMQYRSEAHNWEYIDADAVSDAGYVVQDGEERAISERLDLVQNGNQAAQIAGYALTNGRRGGPYTFPLKPRFRDYKIGECGTIADIKLGFENQKVIIIGRQIDPQSGGVRLVLETEEDSSHAFALGQTTTPPPTPTPFDSEARDRDVARRQRPAGYEQELIKNSYISGVGGNPLTASDAGSDATISVAPHKRVYSDFSKDVDAGAMAGLSYDTSYLVYYDDEDREGGAVNYQFTTIASDGYNSPDNPARHFVGSIRTPASGGAGTGGAGGAPPGSPPPGSGDGNPIP